MPFILRRQKKESWLEAALKVARRWGLSWEVHNSFKSERARGASKEQAAVNACYEWDILPFVTHGD